MDMILSSFQYPLILIQYAVSFSYKLLLMVFNQKGPVHPG
jgi:hypothetical protein